MSRRSLLPVVAAVFSVTTVTGQDVRPTHTVWIDAIAVDGKGASIRTLTEKDFDVREDGRPVKLDAVRFVDGPARQVAIYVDEYHISAGPGAERTRALLTDLVDRTLNDDDTIVVMKPLDSVINVRRQSRDDARRTIAALEGRRDDYAPRTDYERKYMADSPDRVEATRQQLAVSGLNALAVYLGTLGPSRKTLLVVTEALSSPPRRRGQEALATVPAVLRAANRSNVAIYPIDPGEGVHDPSAEATLLRSLGDQTNGRAIERTPRIDDLIAAARRAVGEATGYYMLTYQNPHAEDGTFHPVEVAVKRTGIHVRARAGFWAPQPNERLGADLLAASDRPRPPAKIELPRRTSPLIRPWFGLSMGTAGNMRVTFVWEPTGTVPGDRAQPAARLELTAFGGGDAVLFKGPVLPTGPAALDGAGGEPARAVFDVPPGQLRLSMQIQDADRRNVDFDNRDVSVRDLRGRVAIGTPEFMRARNAREFRVIDSDPQALPVSSREFSRTERLIVRFPAYAPAGQPVAVTARLLNRLGQTMRTLDVRASLSTEGEHEVDLSLASLANGDYQLEVEASTAAGAVKERVDFRVTS